MIHSRNRPGISRESIGGRPLARARAGAHASRRVRDRRQETGRTEGPIHRYGPVGRQAIIAAAVATRHHDAWMGGFAAEFGGGR